MFYADVHMRCSKCNSAIHQDMEVTDDMVAGDPDSEEIEVESFINCAACDDFFVLTVKVQGDHCWPQVRCKDERAISVGRTRFRRR